MYVCMCVCVSVYRNGSKTGRGNSHAPFCLEATSQISADSGVLRVFCFNAYLCKYIVIDAYISSYIVGADLLRIFTSVLGSNDSVSRLCKCTYL